MPEDCNGLGTQRAAEFDPGFDRSRRRLKKDPGGPLKSYKIYKIPTQKASVHP